MGRYYWGDIEGKFWFGVQSSSDVENLPRDKSFFFNRNRLNVAMSRAQCSSIVLLNPQLLEAPPKTLEEFKMINNFNKLLKYKTKTN